MLSTAACTRSAVPRHAARALGTIAILPRSPASQSSRHFSSTRPARLQDFFPAKETQLIKTTPASWPHHGYTMEEMKAVQVGHRKPRSTSDWIAWKTVRFARYWMDKATGMDRDQQVDKKNPTTAVEAEKPLTEAQWVRCIPSLALPHSTNVSTTARTIRLP